jgi:hypothetical protein
MAAHRPDHFGEENGFTQVSYACGRWFDSGTRHWTRPVNVKNHKFKGIHK